MASLVQTENSRMDFTIIPGSVNSQFIPLLKPLPENQVFLLSAKGWNVIMILKCGQIFTPDNIQ